LQPNSDYAFELSALDVLDPANGTMFVAFDERFGNFKRMELMQLVMERGFKLDSFVAPSAIVPAGSVIGPNAFVGEGVVLGMGCRIDFNAVVRDGVRLAAGVHLRSSCWLETGVLVGEGADIGAHSILRTGAIVASRVKVGKHCELGWARLYDKDIAARTVFDTRYPEPICVFGN
jgi:UDP-3-O-[3-hydroxymyristoyl] glucosamine N-acyltransferase